MSAWNDPQLATKITAAHNYMIVVPQTRWPRDTKTTRIFTAISTANDHYSSNSETDLQYTLPRSHDFVSEVALEFCSENSHTDPGFWIRKIKGDQIQGINCSQLYDIDYHSINDDDRIKYDLDEIQNDINSVCLSVGGMAVCRISGLGLWMLNHDKTNNHPRINLPFFRFSPFYINRCVYHEVQVYFTFKSKIWNHMKSFRPTEMAKLRPLQSTLQAQLPIKDLCCVIWEYLSLFSNFQHCKENEKMLNVFDHNRLLEIL